ncbi:metal ABC transporter ATP-binding protein [Litorihabitans aurantiacus]|uniref:ABC transporter n=1 Tax=Litorihabitans aurantiacus TaxID=1930061 RepID=A0AA37UTJ9_9MICO|nr:metal ABC transporter ATP-binding protein [Litorihabitans aurantiacus]GMA30980.1 ABC transporter [Litorihabitans aurantiacus]
MSAPRTGVEETPAAVVDVRGLSVDLGGSRILREVDLTVARGEFVALLGANGSGKSTLVRTLVGVLPPAAGTVTMLGADVTRRAGVPWGRIGYVPQRSTATAGVPATVVEVVRSGLLAAGRLRPPRDGEARVRRALARVDLADRADRAVAELSGGQQQRVLIARALARDPELLLLDEPLAGVDAANQESFARTMAGLRDDGVTVLVVLHETGPLAPLITRAVVLRHGAVVHDGEPPRPAPGHDHDDHDHQHPHDGDHLERDDARGPDDWRRGYPHGDRPTGDRSAIRISPGGFA